MLTPIQAQNIKKQLKTRKLTQQWLADELCMTLSNLQYRFNSGKFRKFELYYLTEKLKFELR